MSKSTIKKLFCHSASFALASVMAAAGCQTGIGFDADCDDGICEDIGNLDNNYQNYEVIAGNISNNSNRHFIVYGNLGLVDSKAVNPQTDSPLQLIVYGRMPIEENGTSAPMPKEVSTFFDSNNSDAELQNAMDVLAEKGVYVGMISNGFTEDIPQKSPHYLEAMPQEFVNLLGLLANDTVQSEIDDVDVANNPCLLGQNPTRWNPESLKISYMAALSQDSATIHPPDHKQTKSVDGTIIENNIRYCQDNLTTYANLLIALETANDKVGEILDEIANNP